MTESLRSAQNPRLQRLKRLFEDAAFRRETGLLPLEGAKLALEALKQPERIVEIYISSSSPHLRDFQKAALPLTLVEAKLLARLGDAESAQGVILLMKRPKLAPSSEAPKLALALDQIQDPGNLGSLLRTAWAAAADRILLGRGCADPFGPKAIRAAAGAQWQLSIEEDLELGERLGLLRRQGIQVLALDPKAKAGLWEQDLKNSVCIVIGSEGQGLSPAALEAANHSCRLEYPGNAESLNAAVCASIVLFEVLRQRQR